jgi:hypothetical protein
VGSAASAASAASTGAVPVAPARLGCRVVYLTRARRKSSGSKEFYGRAGSSDKTLKLYEGHFHDLLADVGKQHVMADIRGVD